MYDALLESTTELRDPQTFTLPLHFDNVYTGDFKEQIVVVCPSSSQICLISHSASCISIFFTPIPSYCSLLIIWYLHTCWPPPLPPIRSLGNAFATQHTTWGSAAFLECSMALKGSININIAAFHQTSFHLPHMDLHISSSRSYCPSLLIITPPWDVSQTRSRSSSQICAAQEHGRAVPLQLVTFPLLQMLHYITTKFKKSGRGLRLSACKPT